jgi:hypothetical protein
MYLFLYRHSHIFRGKNVAQLILMLLLLGFFLHTGCRLLHYVPPGILCLKPFIDLTARLITARSVGEDGTDRPYPSLRGDDPCIVATKLFAGELAL